MKIAMFGHKHFPSREGGIEVVVAELAKRMSVSSKLTIYDRYELNKKKRHKKRHGNITLCLSPTLSNSKLNAMIASFFSTIQCCIGNYDIVHIHAEGPSFFCWLLKLFNKKQWSPSMGLTGNAPNGEGLQNGIYGWERKWPSNMRTKSLSFHRKCMIISWIHMEGKQISFETGSASTGIRSRISWKRLDYRRMDISCILEGLFRKKSRFTD